jgi:hypothetical protein
MEVANTLAYCNTAIVTAVKNFIVQAFEIGNISEKNLRITV